MTKDFGPFFLVSSRATNIGKQLLWIHKLFFWQLPWKLYKLFWDHRRLLKTESFEKKWQNFHRKKKLWSSFSRIIEYGKCEGKIYNGPQYILTKYWANDQTVSFEPKRSIETNISKSSVFTMTKNWPIFPRVIECYKHRGTIYKNPRAILAITVELIRAIFWEP